MCSIKPGYRRKFSACTSQVFKPTIANLVARLLLHHGLSISLLGSKEAAQPGQDITRNDQRAGDHGLATRDNAVATTLLVLARPGAEDVLLALVRLGHGPEDVGEDGVFDLGRLLLDDGHLVVHHGQEVVTNFIDLGDVGRGVGDGRLEVGEGGLDEFGVGGVGQVDGLGAIGMVLEGLDGI